MRDVMIIRNLTESLIESIKKAKVIGLFGARRTRKNCTHANN